MNWFFFLGFVLVVGKAFGAVDLPWLAVTAPFWIPLALSFVVLMIGIGLVWLEKFSNRSGGW